MATDPPKQGSQLGQMGRELLTQLLPLLVTAGGLALLLFAVGSAVSVARFSAAGLPWEQAISAATESDIRTTGLVWLVVFGLLGLLAVTLAYIASPQGQATATMYYALIAIATAEALVVWFAAKEGEILNPRPGDWGALAVLAEAAVGASLVVFGLDLHERGVHLREQRLAAERDVARRKDHVRYGPARAAEREADRRAGGDSPPATPRRLPVWAWLAIGMAAGLLGGVLGALLPDLVDSEWGQRLVFGAGAMIVVGGLFVWNEWRRNEKPQLLGATTKSAGEKIEERPIALTHWAFVFLGVLTVGAGVGAALFLGNAWVAPAQIFAGVLGLLSIRVAELTGTFRWYAVAVFFGVGLFGAVAGVLRMLDEPRLQPVAFLLKDGDKTRAIEGVYVGESDDRLWFASVALEECGDNEVRRGSGRLRSVPTKDVSALSIGPQMGLPKLAHEARAMLDAARREHRGPERMIGPAAVRDAVALESLSPKRKAPGTWVTLDRSEGLGQSPTLTLNGRRLLVHESRREEGRWKVRLPRAAASGPVYADCAENTNRAFLAVPRPPRVMFTATALGHDSWRLEARGSRDPDGQIRMLSWRTQLRLLPMGRTVRFESEGADRTVRLTATDEDGLVSELRVRPRGKLVRVYQSDLLFRFDRRRLTRRGGQRVRSLRDEVENPGAVTIDVHTDERGVSAHNMALSRARARAIARALLGDRAAEARPRGFGEERPIEPGNHRENRRVVVVIS
jgi:outer membrane protein OmpA-like peptidoglycan-associated protein